MVVRGLEGLIESAGRALVKLRHMVDSGTYYRDRKEAADVADELDAAIKVAQQQLELDRE